MTRLGSDDSHYRVALAGRPGEHVTLSFAAVSDVGLRRHANEDSVIVRPPVFAVADGMGGHAAGDLASAAVVARLAELAGREGVDAERIAEALTAAAQDIDGLAQDIPRGVGTTVTGAVLDLRGPSFGVFNVGDSRVYSFLDGRLVQVTVDHSVVQELMDAGMLSAEDAENHPESNVITRALGFREVPRPDFWSIPLQPGLRLLICSDGLTRELGLGRIRDVLGAGTSPTETANELLEAALDAGGRDNVTVVIVDVLETPTVLSTPDWERS
jgi:PPM family protein phosphatase